MSNKNILHKLRKSNYDRMVFGVCGGLGECTPIPSWVWRLVLVLSLLLGGAGIIIYLLLAIFMPAENARY